MKNNVNLIISAILLTLTMTASAEIINVPEDFETIQEGIDAAICDDSVLVQPGVYLENISIPTWGITVGSLILVTNDEAYIDSTIIDGDQQGCVVTFYEATDSTTILRGFTIRNGFQNYGGGIDCRRESRPTMIDLLVTENTAERHGGGIYFSEYAEPDIIRVVIEGNNALYGGGIGTCYRSEAYLKDVVISNNNADSLGGGVCGRRGYYVMENVLIRDNTSLNGGGVCLNESYGNILTNVTISGNIATEEIDFGGILLVEGGSICEIILCNCIIWGNNGTQISMFYNSENRRTNRLMVSYSDIEDGRDGIIVDELCELVWGEGNIDDDPLFVDPENGDYHLTEESPCVDAGDPDMPEDIDGTRSDMGVYPYLRYSIVYGSVLDAASDEPLQNAIITSSEGYTSVTDSLGQWQIPLFTGDYTFTASCSNYLDMSVERQIGFQDTIEIVFELLHSEFDLSSAEVSETLERGDSTRIDLEISNEGNGLLSWTQTTHAFGESWSDPWTLRNSLNVYETVNDDRIQGCLFIDDRFYVTGGGNDTNYVYILDRQGDYINQFPQPGESAYGMTDLAWDGELIWGSGERTVFGFRTDGELVESWEGPENQNQAIAWDSDRNMFWISGIGSNIFGYDRNFQRTELIPRDSIRIYGLAYWSEDPDRCQLYVFHRDVEDDRQLVSKINIDTGERIFVSYLNPEDEGTPVGAFITNQYDRFGGWVFMGVSNTSRQQGGDRIDIWQLQPNFFWLDVSPESGILEPEAIQPITIDFATFDTEHDIMLDDGDYEAEVVFNHNAEGCEFTLPVCLTVTDPDFAGEEDVQIPNDFSLTSVHPNPFNSATVIRYTLPQPSEIKLTLIDYTGRVVKEVAVGRYSAGYHSISVDGSDLPTGLYIARLQAGDVVRYTKLVCVK